MNANYAPLTAHAAGRPHRRQEGHLFFMHPSLECLKGKKGNSKKELTAMQHTSTKPLFPLGLIVATPGALAALEKSGQTPAEFLARHTKGEWGELSEEDRKENQLSLQRGFRLLSSYRTHAGDKLWLITEADRSVTTLLLPEEY
jgi:hypothetical protein